MLIPHAHESSLCHCNTRAVALADVAGAVKGRGVGGMCAALWPPFRGFSHPFKKISAGVGR